MGTKDDDNPTSGGHSGDEDREAETRSPRSAPAWNDPKGSGGDEPATRRSRPVDGGLPERIGRYRIKREIGRGGMGSVYLAQQEQPRRVVALKVMRRGVTSRSALRRFEYESQLLARLRHPNVAQVYEAGTHDDGAGSVPFFVMEYIAGASTITDYAREKRLGTRHRLELFAKVCNAIHHGHQKGIIHRDLKPANLLVDSSGEPKIIDFGVARATDSDLAVTTLQTDIGQLIGTLQYMSPEQCAADPHDLDTRSDVYALGVVLYELLTGRLPYEVRAAAIHEAARIIREEPPARPSTFDKTLRGDVERIALKALEKERDFRYRSAEALADDVGRYLRSEPIQARRPSVSYQFSRFARRHTGLVVSVLAVGVILILATVVSLALLVVADRARRESEHARGRLAEEVVERQRLATEATGAAVEAKRATARAERLAYGLSIQLASRSIDEGSIDHAARYLEEAPIAQRDWEWRFLRLVLDESVGTLSGHAHNVWDVCYSPSGDRILSASGDGSLRLWSSGGRAIETIEAHDHFVMSARFRSDGAAVVSGSLDGTVRTWDARSFAESLVVTTGEPVVLVAYAESNSELVAVHSSSRVTAWDAATGAPRAAIAAEDARLVAAAVSGDGTVLAWSGTDAVTRVVSLPARTVVGRIDHAARAGSVTLDYDGGRLVAGHDDGTIGLYSVSSAAPLWTVSGHADAVTAVAFSPDEKQIASGSRDRTVRTWLAETGGPLEVRRGHRDYVLSLAYSPDGSSLATGAGDTRLGPQQTGGGHGGMGTGPRSIKLWDVHGGARLRLRGHEGLVLALAFSPDDRWLVSAGGDRTVRLWEARSGRAVAVLEGHAYQVASLAVSPDGSILASGDNMINSRGPVTILLWSMEDRTPIRKITGLTRGVRDLQFSRDGKRLYSSGHDGLVVWDVSSATRLRTIQIPGHQSTCIALDQSRNLLVSAGIGGEILVLELDTGRHRQTLVGHEGMVQALDLSSGRDVVISGAVDNTLRIWNLASGAPTHVLRGHIDTNFLATVNDVSTNCTETRIASAGMGDVKLWDLETGQLLLTLHEDRLPVMVVLFDHGCRRIAAAVGPDVMVCTADSVSSPGE